MAVRFIGRWDGDARLLRLVRWTRDRGHFGMRGVDGTYMPYSFKTSLALSARPVGWRRSGNHWEITLLFVRLSHHWSAGGRFSP